MPDELRTLINKSGVVYNAGKTTILFAEDWALLKSWLSYLSRAPILSTSGVVDQTNAVFGFLVKPVILVSDGALSREGKGWTWDAGAKTATLDTPPQLDIFALL